MRLQQRLEQGEASRGHGSSLRRAHVLAHLQLLGRVVEEAQPPRHARAHVAPHGAQHHHHPVGHVLATVVPRPLAHRVGARIPHGEALPRPAPRQQQPPGSAVQARVSQDHVVFTLPRNTLAAFSFREHRRRFEQNLSPRHSLADVVVGLPLEVDGDPRGQKRAQALPRGPTQVQHEGVVGQAAVAPRSCHLPGEHRAHGAVRVDHFGRHHRLPAARCHHRLRGRPPHRKHERVVEVQNLFVRAAVSRGHGGGVGAGLGSQDLRGGGRFPHHPVAARRGELRQKGRGHLGRLGSERRSCAALALASSFLGAQQLLPHPNALVQARAAQRGQVPAHFLRHERQVVDHVVRHPGELVPQVFALGGDPHRAGVQVAHPRHDAPGSHHGGGAKPKLFPAQQGRHHHVQPRADASIHAQQHFLAEPVLHQSAVRLSDSQLPARPRVLDASQWAGPRAAVVP
mmetsp:Transcript_11184/g.22292  ORF Transcript_11184/g.22292 Transcript_11184/m.22292 type:complete len:456 (-) Transcript_11184:1783-3150(-)